jgi:dimethylaniline monooxygenase (N-oxide forming)
MEKRKMRVLVIGAGASGLPAIKCCLDDGLEPVCVERTSDLGGLWNYDLSLKEGGDDHPCVMKSTIINTCKEMMCYSDFPIPAEYPNFMHNQFVVKYLRLYAENFKLLPYIQFNTEVVRLSPAEDFATTGRWEVLLRNRQTKEERTEIFDAVLVCTGHHAEKHMPRFEGEENFKGRRVHTHDFHDSTGYENKRVVIIGIGNSGGDAAVELSRVCSQVYLSTRRGSWVVNRIGHKGLPIDYVSQTRFVSDLYKTLPRWVINGFVEQMLNSRFDHALYGLKPAHRFDAQHVTINDELPNHIAAGTVVIKPNVKRITETAVEFDDGTTVDNVDVIVYATGYIFGFPFINHPALTVKANQVNLYKFVFPPDLRPSTLAVIGCFQPLGAIFPISEMQCRWAARVFKGEVPMPSPAVMWEDVQLKKDEMAKRFVPSQRHTIQVDYVPYMVELSELVGCKPDICAVLKSEPVLGLKLYFGAMTPYHFRLSGHGAWVGARRAIMTTWDRMVVPFQSRKVPSDGCCTTKTFLIIAVVILILAFLARCLF